MKPAEILSAKEYADSPYMSEPFFIYLDVWKELQTLTQSVPPDASGDDFGVADLEGMGRIKAARGREAVGLLMQLMGFDFVTGTYWMDVRRIQDPARRFAPGPTAAWHLLRERLPWQKPNDEREDLPYSLTAYRLMMDHPASDYLGTRPPPPSNALNPTSAKR